MCAPCSHAPAEPNVQPGVRSIHPRTTRGSPTRGRFRDGTQDREPRTRTRKRLSGRDGSRGAVSEEADSAHASESSGPKEVKVSLSGWMARGAEARVRPKGPSLTSLSKRITYLYKACDDARHAHAPSSGYIRCEAQDRSAQRRVGRPHRRRPADLSSRGRPSHAVRTSQRGALHSGGGDTFDMGPGPRRSS